MLSRYKKTIFIPEKKSKFAGVGSSFGTVSGLGMIGSYYDDDIDAVF